MASSALKRLKHKKISFSQDFLVIPGWLFLSLESSGLENTTSWHLFVVLELPDYFKAFVLGCMDIFEFIAESCSVIARRFLTFYQVGRTLQPFVGSKNGNENFRQARIYNFRVKSVVLARNRKFAKLTQWNMQYIPCDSVLLAQETLFLTQKGTFFAQRSPKQCINRDKS